MWQSLKNGRLFEMGIVPQLGTPFGAMRERFLSQLGIPCQAPPFGTMSAIDLKTRKTGRQYVVISAGGARQSPDRGDYVIAYALPKK